MGIVGITRDKEGAPIIRQAVTHKLVIGRAPVPGSNAPKKLDHIAFMRKNAEGKWVDDEELTNYYKQKTGGQPVRSVEIVLFDNDIEQVFRCNYMAYIKRGCWCKGDGEKAERRDLGEDRKGWGAFKIFDGPCANGGCPFPEQKKCKPIGTLQFSLMEHLKLGSVCKVQTTGKQSIAQLYSALETLRRMTGGVIKGIPIKLFVQPDRALYMDQGQAKTGSKFVWGLEVNARDFQEMRRQLTAGPQEFYQILQLGQGTIIDAEEEHDEDIAEEVIGEFAYAEGDGSAVVQATAEARSAGSDKDSGATSPNLEDLRDQADALLTQIGKNRAYRDAEIGKYSTAEQLTKFVEGLRDQIEKRKKGAEAKKEPHATRAETSTDSGAAAGAKKASAKKNEPAEAERDDSQITDEDQLHVTARDVQPESQPNFEW